MSLRIQGTAPILLPFLAALALVCLSCASTSVQTFASPEEATAAIVTAAEAGDDDEANRIFDSFARSSVKRDQVYASLFDTASSRYESGRSGDAARILGFVTKNYPNAVAAREALVYSLFLERAEAGVATDESTEAMEAAIKDVRSSVATPSPWVDLADTQVAIDKNDLPRARRSFDAFLARWDGAPASVVLYVEDIDRYLQSH